MRQTVLTLLFLVAAAACRRPETVAALWLLLLTTRVLARRPWLAWQVRSLAVTPFTLAALPVALHDPWQFGTVVGRAVLSLQATLFLHESLGSQRLLACLGRLGLPRLFVAVVAATLRYSEVLLDELQRMRRARLSRSGSGRPAKGGRPPSCSPLGSGTHTRVGWRFQAQSSGHLAGNLFLRALDRSDRVHRAMLSRGYDGRPLSLAAEPTWTRGDAGVCLAALGLLVTLLCWR